LEFGLGQDEAVGDHWPFGLRYPGRIDMPDGPADAYKFFDNDERYIALCGGVLEYAPAADLNLTGLR